MSWKKLNTPAVRNQIGNRLRSLQVATDQKLTNEAVIALPMDKIPFYSDYSREKCDLRREWVEAYSKTKLKHLSRWWTDDADTTTLKGNIELPVGAITMPVAVAGPLKIRGKHASGDFLLPLATTEGALVASINRGARALSMSGGTDVVATHQQLHRAPFFKTGSPEEAVRLGKWAAMQVDAIQKEVVEKHSNHAKLTHIIPFYDMEYVHLMFTYETGDASGQNMVTVCTWNALSWIKENLKKSGEDVVLKKIYIEANLSGDKKNTNFSAVVGRGISVSAKAIIPERILNKTLNTSAESLYELGRVIARMAERSNMCGSNGNIANVLGASFAACGQDIACVNEASVGRTDIEINPGPEKGIIFSLYMPNLVVGTVGGGTSLPTQKECLDIIGCHGKGKARKLAEIIACYCLALDLSTMSAVEAGEFVNAHEALGRNKPQ